MIGLQGLRSRADGPLAEFVMAGMEAINFTPGDPRYAHRSDERVEMSGLIRSYEVLRVFLTKTDAEEASA